MNTQTRKLKIAFIIVNLQGGGAEKAILNLASALSSQNHEVHLLLLKGNHDYSLNVDYHVHVLAKDIQGGVIGNYLSAFMLKQKYRKLSQNRVFDICISTLPFTDRVVSLAKIPNVWFRIANTLSAEINKISAANPKKAARRLARYKRTYDGQNLIAVSNGVANDLKNNLDFNNANIKTIYNLYDFEKIRVMSSEYEPDIPTFPFVIYVGRFTPQKRFDLLFSAWKRAGLSHKLILLTKHSSPLEQMIEDKGVAASVVVAGFKTNPYPWIKRAEMLVLTSDHEGLPNVLVESLICGTKIVSTDCPSGPSEIMSGDLNRYLVPMNDPDTLANAMVDALQSPFLLPLGFTDKYSSKKTIAKYESLS
ncbi:MAG: glycosyltransferase [Methyloprofundus sp.]|nr:glycosyltransferase [Methyloprofundus sp.]